MIILYILVSIVVLYLFLMILQSILCKQSKFTIYFGIPGSGKSTIAALIAKKEMKKRKKGRRVFSNFAIKGTNVLNKEDIGVYDMYNSLLIIDEAGVDYDNRNWKNNLNPDQVYFYKHYRHYHCDIVMFSQSIDVDIKLRNLANEYRIVKKSIIPFFVTTKLIKKKIDINKDTGEIIDRYYFVFLSSKRYFSPKAWKLFNSYQRKELLTKQYDVY